MDLVPYMYWEQQESGSQLCAQHCLNNLLQQFTYSEFDLAEIARRLDKAENAELATEHKNKKSYNYDDTGFFSISVLERALEVWDLSLVRWRGEAMRQYQDHPEDQVAFILNLSSHWIPLRRFGSSYSAQLSSKRWYNLNSFLRHPDWISPTYLQMVLSQAEQEGYSVFCVRKLSKGPEEEGEDGEGEGWGDGGVAVLPDCQADMFATQLGEPQGRTGGSLAQMSRGVIAGSSRVPMTDTNPDQPSVDPSSITPPAAELADPISDPASSSRRRRHQQAPEDSHAELEDELMHVESAPVPSRSRGPAEPVAVWQTGDENEDDEDEDLRSEAALRPGYGEPREQMDFSAHQRDYDDEDAALQAALKASMEDIPSDWVAPPLQTSKPAKPSRAAVDPVAREQSIPAKNGSKMAQGTGGGEEVMTTAPSGETKQADRAVPARKASKFTEEITEDDDAPEEALSPDEIRKKRLARFGG